jgi:hypothetical protein
MKSARHYTNLLLEQIEEGILDKDTVIQAFACYLSESDVEEMMRMNEFLFEEEEEDSDEEE